MVAGNVCPIQGDETPASPFVAISILNWNGWKDTIECLECVRRLNYPDYLTVVVDNGSSNDSVERIRDWARKALPDPAAFVEYSRETASLGGDSNFEPCLDAAESPNRLVLIRNEQNLGFAGGNNLSISYALQRQKAARSVLLLNNDAMPERDCLAHLVATSRTLGASVVGAVVKDASNQHVRSSGHMNRFPLLHLLLVPQMFWRRRSADLTGHHLPRIWVTGTAMLVNARALGKLLRLRGCCFDEGLFLYCEDFELCYVLYKMGHRAALATRAVVLHGGARSSGGPSNPIAYYYMTRNIILLGKTYLPFALKPLFHAVRAAEACARVLKNLRAGRRRAAKAISDGWLDGWRGTTGIWAHHT